MIIEPVHDLRIGREWQGLAGGTSNGHNGVIGGLEGEVDRGTRAKSLIEP